MDTDYGIKAFLCGVQSGRTMLNNYSVSQTIGLRVPSSSSAAATARSRTLVIVGRIERISRGSRTEYVEIASPAS